MAQALRIVWSGDALADVDEIAAYIHKDSPYYAQLVAEKLFAAAEALPDNPLRGRQVPEFGEDHIRELFVYSYRLTYELRADAIHILAVVHGKRLIRP